MKIISKKICTVHATMTIKYSEICRFFPIGYMFRFAEIQYYCNSIFIVLSDWSLVRRCRICPDSSMTIFGVLGRLEIADRHEHFRQHGVMILMRFDASFFQMKRLRLNKNFLPDDLIYLLNR